MFKFTDSLFVFRSFEFFKDWEVDFEGFWLKLIYFRFNKSIGKKIIEI